MVLVRKRNCGAIFIVKHDDFAKTGSGQTWGKHSKINFHFLIVCANESHSHHHGVNDSLLVQWQKTQDTFKEYAKRGAEKRVVCAPVYTEN